MHIVTKTIMRSHMQEIDTKKRNKPWIPRYDDLLLDDQTITTNSMITQQQISMSMYLNGTNNFKVNSKNDNNKKYQIM